MEGLFLRIQELKQYYSQLSNKQRSFSYDPVWGIDDFVNIVLDGLMLRETSGQPEGVVDLSQVEGSKILDTECGDSYSLALFSMFGFDAYGFDQNPARLYVSRKASSELRSRGLIEKGFKVVEGSYKSEGVYEALGVPFWDFDYIIHRYSAISLNDIMQRFADKAKDDARLILLGSRFRGLKRLGKNHGLGLAELDRPYYKSDIEYTVFIKPSNA